MASRQWRVARKRDPIAERPSTPIGTQTPRTQRSCHFGPLYTLALHHAFASLHAKSNYSRTYAKYSRKSNYSRTYAKTGGWGVSDERAISAQRPGIRKQEESRSPARLLWLATCLPRAIFAKGHPPLATNSDHYRSIGNRCPTSRGCSHIYHYIKYRCRRADNFAFTRDGGQTEEPT